VGGSIFKRVISAPWISKASKVTTEDMVMKGRDRLMLPKLKQGEALVFGPAISAERRKGVDAGTGAFRACHRCSAVVWAFQASDLDVGSY
jgi:hypothetical protein